MIKLHIPIEPFGAARLRARAIPTEKEDLDGQRIWRATTYKATKYRKWQEALRPLLAPKAPVTPLLGPLECRILFIGPTLSAKIRVRTPAPREWWEARPDFDNLLKAIWDTLQDVGFFRDDGQIVRVVGEKIRAGQGEETAIHVQLKELGPRDPKAGPKPVQVVLPFAQEEEPELEPPPAPANATPRGDLGNCRSCGARIIWSVTAAGKRAPYDLDGTSHFATCPQGREWRKKR